MKILSRVGKIGFVVAALICIGIVLWPPRDRGVNIGQTCFVWAGLGHIEFQRYQVGLINGGVENRVQFGPVLTIRQSQQKK